MSAKEWKQVVHVGQELNTLGDPWPFRIEAVEAAGIRFSRLKGKRKGEIHTLKYPYLTVLVEHARQHEMPTKRWNEEAERIWAPYGYADSSAEAQYWALTRLMLLHENNVADDGDATAESSNEGRASTVLSTKYERDRGLREQCIAEHGHSCAVCEFDFEERYGGLGKKYIQVHHLNPLWAGERETIAKDLRPVCANCHVMLHRHHPKLYSVKELRRMLRNPS